jgi:hypothetical protein
MTAPQARCTIFRTKAEQLSSPFPLQAAGRPWGLLHDLLQSRNGAKREAAERRKTSLSPPTPFQRVTSRIRFCGSSANRSAVNLSPCPPGIRSADIGYFGLQRPTPTSRKVARLVLNQRSWSAADRPKASASAAKRGLAGVSTVSSGSGVDTGNARSKPHRRSTATISLASTTQPWRAATPQMQGGRMPMPHRLLPCRRSGDDLQRMTTSISFPLQGWIMLFGQEIAPGPFRSVQK